MNAPMRDRPLRKLENPGLLLLNGDSQEKEHTLVIIGLSEAGAAMARRAVRALGIPFGELPLDDAVREFDPAARDQAVRALNAHHPRWALQLPDGWTQLPELCSRLRHPRFMIVFEDILGVSRQQDEPGTGTPFGGMRRALDRHRQLLDLLSTCQRPALLASHEKAMGDPAAFVDALVDFCGLPPDPARRESALATIAVASSPGAEQAPPQGWRARLRRLTRRRAAAPQDTNPLVFLHIPKTAGTSLRQLLRERLSVEELIFLDPPLNADRQAEVARRLPRIRALLGHLYFGIDEQLGFHGDYVTFLRDPVARVVSFWKHQQTHPHAEYHDLVERGVSLREFVLSGQTHQTDNFMTRILVGTRAPGMLDGSLNQIDDERYLQMALDNVQQRFRFVGFVERFDESVQELFRTLGWPLSKAPAKKLNVLGSGSTPLDEATLAAIRKHNALDIALYQRLLQASPWQDKADATAVADTP